jgi:MarR family transcriptional regulator for hemolysin
MTFKGESEFDAWAKRFYEQYEEGSRLEKEFRLTRKLILTARRWTSYIDEVVKKRTGHSRARWQTLSALSFSEGTVGTLELARRLAVRWPTLIRVLNELEAEGLIRRLPDPGDKRMRLVAITPEGRRVMARVRDILDPARSRVLAHFSDEELVIAERVLDRIFEHLVDEVGEA